jgi:hypothetical protein
MAVGEIHVIAPIFRELVVLPGAQVIADRALVTRCRGRRRDLAPDAFFFEKLKNGAASTQARNSARMSAATSPLALAT